MTTKHGKPEVYSGSSGLLWCEKHLYEVYLKQLQWKIVEAKSNLVAKVAMLQSIKAQT